MNAKRLLPVPPGLLTLLCFSACSHVCTVDSIATDVAYRLRHGASVLQHIAAPEPPQCDLRLQFEDGSALTRKQGERTVTLDFHPGSAILEDTRDLAYLMQADCVTGVERSSLRALLGSQLKCLGWNFRKLRSPAGDDWYGGNPKALNDFGSASFNYAVIEQFYSDRRAQSRGETNGLECYAATAMHMYKALGLVRPDLDRKGIELRYTTMHGPNPGNGVIPGAYYRHLRGYYDSPYTAQTAADIANILRQSDWAKLTGSRALPLEVRAVKAQDLSVKLKSSVVFATFNARAGFAGHAFLITELAGETLRADESYAWQPAKRIPFVKDGYALLYTLEPAGR